MTKSVRKSVPTLGVHRYWIVGWSYVMPDFDNNNHSIIEWLGEGQPAEPDLDLGSNIAADLQRTA